MKADAKITQNARANHAVGSVDNAQYGADTVVVLCGAITGNKATRIVLSKVTHAVIMPAIPYIMLVT